MAYQRFAAVRGHPVKALVPTNFVSAKPVLEDLYAFLQGQNSASLEEYAIETRMSWTWKVLPADLPHQNGATEAGVKVVRRALQSLGKPSDLTFNEFLTALQLAANLVNEPY